MDKAVVVMQGPVAEVGLAELLQVVGVSRQYTAVELRDERNSIVGAIWLKAGRVLSVSPNHRDARTSFAELIRQAAGCAFLVYRLPDERNYPEPLGPLDQLLMAAIAENSPATSPPPPAAPKPVPRPVLVLEEEPKPAKPSKRPPLESTRPASSKAARAPVVAVLSPKGGVGKTTVSLNLAVAFARRGLRVVLVDADPNGDVASALDAQANIRHGLYDVLTGSARLSDVLRTTALDTLRVLPARGADTDPTALDPARSIAHVDRVLSRLSADSDLVLVDCPAGVFGASAAVIRAASHAIGIFQAELVASRSFDMLSSALQRAAGVELLGVVVNMFSPRSEASCAALTGLVRDERVYRPFEVTIPRSEAFALATLEGQPLATSAAPSQIAWLFEGLADEASTRLGVRAPTNEPRGSFLR